MFLDIMTHHLVPVSLFHARCDLSLHNVVNTILEQCNFVDRADQQEQCILYRDRP